MKELLLATANPGKAHEIIELFKDVPDLIFSSLADLNFDSTGFVEDGETYRENALKKARYFSEKSGKMCLADDSGILVEALSGEMGVRTRRWGLGEKVSDQEWVEYFLSKMRDVPDDARVAKFFCCACVYDAGLGLCEFFEGETPGLITKELEAPIMNGLPLSSCFRPDGFDRVYAALEIEEKNRVSHRGKAMSKAKEFLASL